MLGFLNMATKSGDVVEDGVCVWVVSKRTNARTNEEEGVAGLKLIPLQNMVWWCVYGDNFGRRNACM